MLYNFYCKGHFYNSFRLLQRARIPIITGNLLLRVLATSLDLLTRCAFGRQENARGGAAAWFVLCGRR